MKERGVKLVLIKQNKRHSTIKQKERAWAHDWERQETITTFSMTIANEQTLIANEVEGVVPFTQGVRKGEEQQQQTTTKKTETKSPQFAFDF